MLFHVNSAIASESQDTVTFDPGPMIDHHVADAHSWEIFHGLVIHLPVIIYSKERGVDIFSSSELYDAHGKPGQYGDYILDDHEHIELADGGKLLDLSITKNVLFIFINAGLLFLVFYSVAMGYKKNIGKAPSGIQSFFEPIILYVRDEVVKPSIGPKYEKYLPYMLTLFFYIWFGNVLGLLPAAANMTGNIAITLMLALATFIITTVSGKKTYWMHMLDPMGNSMSWLGKIPLYIILVPIELIGIFTKPFAEYPDSG